MTNNTINNVPRELLADLLGNDHDKRIMAERHLLAMLANAPSSACVDGLEVVAWQQRYIDPDEGVSVWGHADARSASILKGRSDYELRPLYAVPPDAQAIIDWLRVELQQSYQQVNSECMDWAKEYERRKAVQAERDTLKSMLREFAVGISKREMPTEQELNSWFDRIDAALSAGKEGE